MKLNSLLGSWLVGAVAACSLSACATAATDYNEVGKQVALLLQNAHFDRMNKSFDSNLSMKFFDTYLNELDSSHIFFTQKDVEKLRKKYGAELDSYLITSETMTPAEEIYKLFLKRVEERIAYAKDLLKKNDFKFDQNKTIDRLRKKSPWPKDTAEADALWRDRIEEQLLSEILRKETISKLAKEQGKHDPSASEKSPSERLILRYERILRSLQEADKEDMANYLLSAVTHTFDPHTDYMSARELDRFKSAMAGSLKGIGALLEAEDDGSVKIAGIVVGGPADKSNKLKLNDRIVAVDSNNDGDMTDILFMKIDKVVDMIRGPENSTLRMKIESPDSPGQAKIITLTRSTVEMKDEQAKAQIVEEKNPNGTTTRVGIISLPSFYFDMDGGERKCSVDIEKLINRLKKENVEALIFDLRGNGGGSLEEVRRMGGFFVGGGPIVQVKDTRGTIAIQHADKKEPIFTKPVVVLTDKLSASASEILAAALQDYGRAVIVGDTSTFGKGTVQKPIDISNFLPYFSDPERAGALKVTIQKFYRVAGGSTQNKGVVSDIIIPTPSAAFEIGESHLEYPLPYDEIPACKDYTKDKTLAKIMPELKKRSAQRVATDPDFKLLSEEIRRTKDKLDENKLSINKQVRKDEINEQEAWRKKVNQERKARYAEIAQKDKERYNLFRLTLEDLASPALTASDWKKDKESTMKMAKNETDDLDDSPDIPSGLDPETREALNVVKDIVELTKALPADKAGETSKSQPSGKTE